MEQNELDSWQNFVGVNFLKPSSFSKTDPNGNFDVEEARTHFKDVPFKVQEVETDDNGNLIIILDRPEENESWKFQCNVTNANFLKDAGIESPKMLLNKNIYFRIGEARNPTLKKDVPTLRIAKVE